MALKIEKVSNKEDNSVHTNHLHFKISGNNIDYVVVNSLRRILLEELPGFAYDINSIKISKNSSVYNNDYLKNRIENFPVMGIDVDFNIEEFLKLKYEKDENEIENENENEKNNLSNFNMLNFYVNKVNNSDDIMNVTTNDCVFFLKGNKIKNIYKNPLLICKLKKGEELELSAIIKKGLPIFHSKYSPIGVCYYDEINDNEFIFKVENRNQYKNKDIIIHGCDILIKRLEIVMNKIISKKFSSNNHGKIILSNENHTLGNLISRGLQENQNIDYAAYKLDHLLINDLTIEYVTNGSKVINEIIENVIKKQIKLFEEIKTKIKSL